MSLHARAAPSQLAHFIGVRGVQRDHADHDLMKFILTLHRAPRLPRRLGDGVSMREIVVELSTDIRRNRIGEIELHSQRKRDSRLC